MTSEPVVSWTSMDTAAKLECVTVWTVWDLALEGKIIARVHKGKPQVDIYSLQHYLLTREDLPTLRARSG